MKSYRVISPFTVRDTNGNPTKEKAKVGELVSLTATEGERLIKARCVIEVEEAVQQEAPENRITRGRKKRA